MTTPNREPKRFQVALFDFGGVFVDSPFPAFREVCRKKGLDGELLIELTFGPLDRDSDHPWHRIERGETSMLDARLEILELIRAAGMDVDPFVLLAKTLLPNKGGHPAVLEAVRHLHSLEVKVGLVTNNAIEIRERWRSILPLDELFDTVEKERSYYDRIRPFSLNVERHEKQIRAAYAAMKFWHRSPDERGSGSLLAR